MKTILLKSLSIKNFKGIKALEIDFSNNTEIIGANATGKTTVFDAFTWLLYGKNSHDQTDFSIKTLDENNEPIHHLDHEVVGVFEINGQEKTFRRVFKEKWQKKRGNDFEEMTGHESTFFVDDVPQSATAYKTIVSQVIEEDIQRMISSPYYFNEQINWTVRRKILETMAGSISNDDIVEKLDGDNAELLKMLQEEKHLEGERKRIAALKKKYNDELKAIPARIDEVQQSIPEEKDWTNIEKEIETLDLDLEGIDKKIEDKTKAVDEQNEAISKMRIEKFEKEEKLKSMERQLTSNKNESNDKVQSEIDALKLKVGAIERNKQNADRVIERDKSDLKRIEEDSNALRSKWNTINDEQFKADPDSTKCPACKRELEDAEEKLEELRANFNQNKLDRLKKIEESGKANKKKIKELEDSIKEHEENGEAYNNQIAELNKELEKLQSQIKTSNESEEDKPEPTPEMIALKKEIDEMVVPESISADTEDLKAIRKEKQDEKQRLLIELSGREAISKRKNRLTELQEQQKTYSQDIATLEKVEFQINNFFKTKSQMIESAVNDKFAVVKFKMFEKQINGGETETCECMVNGVPYKDLNTATKINAGLDIVNALQYHYGILSPVFIDGRESITNIIPMECQTITLKVDPEAKELTVLSL